MFYFITQVINHCVKYTPTLFVHISIQHYSAMYNNNITKQKMCIYISSVTEEYRYISSSND